MTRGRAAARLARALLGLAVLAPVVALTPGAALAATAAPSAGPTASPTSATPSATPSATASATATQPDDSPAVRLTLSDLAPSVARPSDTLRLTGTITNATDQAFVDPVLTIGVQQVVPRTRTALERWFAEDSAPTARLELTRQESLRVEAGATAAIVLDVPVTDLGFPIRFDNWGARGLEITLTSGDVQAVVRTVGVFYPEEGVEAALDVGVLLPVTPSATEWTDTLEAGGSPAFVSTARTQALLDVAESGATLAVDPVVLPDSDGVLPATAPLLTLPWADADEAVLPVAGPAGDELLARARERAAASFAGTRWTPSSSVAWPASPGVTADLVQALVDDGYDGLVLADDALPAAPLGTADARVDLTLEGDATSTAGSTGTADSTDNLPALVADAGLSDTLAGTGTVPHAGVTAALAQRQLAVATTAVVVQETQAPTEVLALVDRTAAAALTPQDARALEDALAALASAPWVNVTDVPTLLARPAAATTAATDLTAASALTPDLQGVVDDTVVQAEEAQRLSSAFTDPEQLAALGTGVTDTLAVAPSAAWRLGGQTGDLALQRVSDALATASTGVAVAVPQSLVSMLAEEGVIPLSLTNTLEETVTVHVHVRPGQAILRVEDTPDVTLAPGQSETVRVPVTAVANGQTTLTVTVTSPDGAPMAQTSRFTVRVRAEWESVGLGIAAAALAVLLVLGLIRTIRRGRRRADGVPR